jgi:hypothetical protein
MLLQIDVVLVLMTMARVTVMVMVVVMAMAMVVSMLIPPQPVGPWLFITCFQPLYTSLCVPSILLDVSRASTHRRCHAACHLSLVRHGARASPSQRLALVANAVRAGQRCSNNLTGRTSPNPQGPETTNTSAYPCCRQ